MMRMKRRGRVVMNNELVMAVGWVGLRKDEDDAP